MGVNPYVSYANSTSATQVVQSSVNQIVVVSPLVPVSSSYAITVPINATTNTLTTATDVEQDASLESLLESLSQSVGAALLSELSK